MSIPERHDENSNDRSEWLVLGSTMIVGSLVLFMRHPDVLLNAQFFIEDGLFYAQAHELGGFQALLQPYSRGYLTLAMCLSAWIAQAFPLAWAPSILNGLALVIGVLPAVLLASRRFEDVVPARAGRFLLAFLYLALPGTWTTIGNITHSMWHLAFLAALVVIARPPKSFTGKILDISILLLSGLTGPLCVFVAIVAALRWWGERERWMLVLLSTSSILALIQGLVILSGNETLDDQRLAIGAGALPLARLVAWRITFGLLYGEGWTTESLEDPSSWMLNSFAVWCAAAAGVAVLAFAAWRGPRALRLLILFGITVLVGAIVWPPRGVYHQGTYVEALSIPGNGNRYFIFLIYALAVSLLWLATRDPWPARVLGISALAVVLVFGVRNDWREPPLRDYGFEKYVEKYERAQAGQRVQIVHPPGWSIVLTKR